MSRPTGSITRIERQLLQLVEPLHVEAARIRLAELRDQYLDEAARIAEADLIGIPGVVPHVADRDDGGSSEAATRRIASRIRGRRWQP